MVLPWHQFEPVEYVLNLWRILMDNGSERIGIQAINNVLLNIGEL
jgi:hypothetical protein